MKGIQFVVDDTGKIKAVIVNLEEWGELWEDFYDILVSESRMSEARVAWSDVKDVMTQTDKATRMYKIEFVASACLLSCS